MIFAVKQTTTPVEQD